MTELVTSLTAVIGMGIAAIGDVATEIVGNSVFLIGIGLSVLAAAVGIVKSLMGKRKGKVR